MISLPDNLTPFEAIHAQAIVEYGFNNVYTIDDQLDARNGFYNDERIRAMQVLRLGNKLVLVFAVEEHPTLGLVQCLAVYNENKDGQLINPESILNIAWKYFGFDLSKDFEFERPQHAGKGVISQAIWQQAKIGETY